MAVLTADTVSDPVKKPPIEPDNPFGDLVPKGPAGPSEEDPFADLVKAANPTTYGMQPAPPAAPKPRKPGIYKPPPLQPMAAEQDVTDITKKADHTLGHHLPGQGTDLPNALAESAMEMITHPQHVAADIAMTAPRAGAAWSDVVKGTGTKKDAAVKTLQALALGAAGPAEKALAERLLGTLGEKLGGAVASTAVGSAAGASFTPDRPILGAILGGAGGVARLPGAVKELGDVSEGAIEAGAQALKPPPSTAHLNDPELSQPQPLTRPQEVLRARLATEGVVPVGPIRRRPAPVEAPPVEPPPEAAAYVTKGAVRRPAAAIAPPEPSGQPEPPPEPTVERRTEPRAPGDIWTPERRSAYVLEQQKKFIASTGNKLWSAWTPAEKEAYFADQARVKQEIADARAKVGDQEFSRQAVAAAAEVPPAAKMEAIVGTAHDINLGETAHYPPEPKPGDLRPVVSSNSEFEARPGVMRDVNKGQQPTALNSPLRLPEPTPEDRAIVQPKGYKEVSPEEVAARKAAERPEPVITEHPARQEMPQGAKVDEEGLFFDHRTPAGALRPFNRVSTDGLIKAQRELMDQIQRDQQASIYRNVEADVSGTQYGVHINVGDRTERGTTYQAEAAERLRNYEKVQGRLDAELAKRGLTNDDIHALIREQEDMEGAIEQEAIHHANATDEADAAFGDFEDLVPEKSGEKGTATKSVGEKEPPISDVLNVAKLNLGSKTAEQRMAAKLEEFRAQREANKQTFSEADVNRKEILDELRAGDPIALTTEKAKKLSGEELLARRDLVRENDQIIQGLSKRLEGASTPEEHQQAAELLQKAVAHNDALLSDLVTGSSQKGRDLNLLRRMAQQSLDPDVWRVQAKRMLGDRPLTAEVDAMIRKYIQEATDACG